MKLQPKHISLINNPEVVYYLQADDDTFMTWLFDEVRETQLDAYRELVREMAYLEPENLRWAIIDILGFAYYLHPETDIVNDNTAWFNFMGQFYLHLQNPETLSNPADLYTPQRISLEKSYMKPSAKR